MKSKSDFLNAPTRSQMQQKISLVDTMIGARLVAQLNLISKYSTRNKRLKKYCIILRAQ